MSDRFDEMQSTESWEYSYPKNRGLFRIRTLLWAIAIIGLSFALLMPAMRSAPEAAHNAQCVNNLKQIGLALHNYQEMYETLPPAYVTDDDGTPLHSWRVLILPFLDRKDLYGQYRFDEPWNGPNNRKLAERIPEVFRCPAIAKNRWSIWGNSPGENSLTPYVVLTGEETPFPGPRAMKSEEITDGTSNTMMVVELDMESGVPWMAPQDIDPAGFSRMLSVENQHRLQHPPGLANVAFADGSVKFLKKSIDRKTLRSLSTANGGETISADAY
jgi:prepilin-type processing-associated H-X9-DG protein